MKITDIVGAGKVCTFKFWKQNELWYEAENGFLFPVQTHDAGTATFNATEKSIFLMRWIRKYLKSMEDTEAE